MKIYNKNGFISGIIFLIVCILGLMSIIIGGWSLKIGILFPILLLISITQIKRSFSRVASKEDIISETDEREQFIALQTSYKVLQIIRIINYIVLLASTVTYAVTRVQFFLGCVILSSVYFTLFFVTEIFLTVYYEKHKLTNTQY